MKGSRRGRAPSRARSSVLVFSFSLSRSSALAIFLGLCCSLQILGASSVVQQHPLGNGDVKGPNRE